MGFAGCYIVFFRFLKKSIYEFQWNNISRDWKF
ncbi:hypothetical protein Patl1_27937 [Pistacia atlantica]|uniref:Uncharacterized protein n=1 Tax=Pistacia atlantica TaxID=434234 RepID=A0ACC1BH26_9ROSI|nr:hypothetical protein Patl1_27937 [Pistacia atlantica]